MLVFCTLFDSGYVDKGLVMYESLKKVCGSFRLYVVAFDDMCYKVLSDYESEYLIPICLRDFEDEKLLAAKKNRTSQEYCWTCSCHAIRYVLKKYCEPVCTYIDADMFFYSDPKVLMKELVDAEADVGIIEQGLDNHIENKRVLQWSGKFCVEFNTFFATENGLKVLEWWCDRCIERCTSIPDGQYFGDQKYLDDWETRFRGVHVYVHKGAGVAPWNVSQYRLKKMLSDELYVKWGKKTYQLIFYHFQAIKYLTNNTVDIGVNLYPGKAQKKLLNVLYIDYLRRIEQKRKQLACQYAIDFEKGKRKPFNKMLYVQEDIMGERNPLIIFEKIWRILIRKKRDIYYKGDFVNGK